MIQIQLHPEIEKKFKRLKDDLDFVMGLEEFIAEEYRMAFELTHETLESYADGLREELGDERDQNAAIFKKKWTKRTRGINASITR